MNKILCSLIIFISFYSIASGDFKKQALNAADKAYSLSKCISYLEIAGMSHSKEYKNLYYNFYNEISFYIKAYKKNENVRANAHFSNSPMLWRVYIESSTLPTDILIGRMLEKAFDIEMENVAKAYSPNSLIIPESAGYKAYNDANCYVFVK
ncbi:hypothetical protein KKI90_01510 [Xenorhabdus bovienii]|uniref:hypothetical protein n=1 Tax=Xenorhabdus bovienii TaxID=40576 RepID=UPI00237CB99F|nr:hypothetical protein [Xenorhabdus bovienii]MDE1485130.1 hypothetical protein [Xenorhabdus bovienii]MDE9475993.1 hypothetical protein [Xenorhabdus bovienii]MDE9528762.1 hypothetical protein [Xenorhabdus bovienii]